MTWSIEPLDDVRQYTSFASRVDLASADASPVAPRRNGARWLRVDVVGSGTLAVVLAGSGGTVRTLTVAAGDELVGRILSIETTTNVSRLTVGW